MSHANTHVVLLQLFGHSEFDPMKYPDDEILRAINELAVRRSQHLICRRAEERLKGPSDSIVVETNVHYLTDRNLLWDAARMMVRLAAALAEEWKLPG